MVYDAGFTDVENIVNIRNMFKFFPPRIQVGILTEVRALGLGLKQFAREYMRMPLTYEIDTCIHDGDVIEHQSW